MPRKLMEKEARKTIMQWEDCIKRDMDRVEEE